MDLSDNQEVTVALIGIVLQKRYDKVILRVKDVGDSQSIHEIDILYNLVSAFPKKKKSAILNKKFVKEIENIMHEYMKRFKIQRDEDDSWKLSEPLNIIENFYNSDDKLYE
ncbi:hypothetical protein D3C76_1149870 [compost metagenome]